MSGYTFTGVIFLAHVQWSRPKEIRRGSTVTDHQKAEFAVRFSSPSFSLSHSLKSSVFLSENIIIFHSNDYFFTQYLFLNQKKGAIWWLFHDHLRAREREEKVTTNSAPNSPDAILISYVLVILQTLHCLIFIGML